MFDSLMGGGGGGFGINSSTNDTGSALSGGVSLPFQSGGIQFGLTGKQQTQIMVALAAAAVVVALVLASKRR